MTVNISAKKELGISKLIEVKESNKNIRATWELQKMMAKLSIDQATTEDSPEAFEKMIDMMLDVQNKTIAYIVSILRLDQKQADNLEEMEFGETTSFAVRISSELLHVEAEEATEAEAGL
ncbi:phage tail tube assembly chaperone [Leuconostoc citreum]|uniref:phage tail tube assembly chaperone n=1 Tax=Leuconostoc citreum TaxID=33964 RepID=UPI0032DE7396